MEEGRSLGYALKGDTGALAPSSLFDTQIPQGEQLYPLFSTIMCSLLTGLRISGTN